MLNQSGTTWRYGRLPRSGAIKRLEQILSEYFGRDERDERVRVKLILGSQE